MKNDNPPYAGSVWNEINVLCSTLKQNLTHLYVLAQKFPLKSECVVLTAHSIRVVNARVQVCN